MTDNSERKRELISKLNLIHNRTMGNSNDDFEDAVEALLVYIDDPIVRQLFERIRE